MWDDYKALPEVQFFLHWWWAEALLVAVFALVLLVGRWFMRHFGGDGT